MSKIKNPFAFFNKIDLSFIPEAINAVSKYGKQHMPTILTVTGIVGFWYAGVSGALAYEDARNEIEEINQQREENGEDPIDRLDEYKIIAKHEVKPAGIAVGATVCIGGANKISAARLAGMTAMWRSAKGELDAITERVEDRSTDELKKGDLKRARQEHNAKRYEENPVRDKYDIYDTHKGNTLFVETFSGERFYSSTTEVNTAITQLNTILQEEGYVLLEDFYDLLGIASRTKKCGKYHAFRYNGRHDVIQPCQILDWQEYTDPVSGEPRICFINFERFLTPSDDYAEIGPW